jgi:hypothetical protein
MGIFDYDAATGLLDPQPANQRYDDLDFDANPTACPGAATDPAPDGSNPFLADGFLQGKCDPADIPPGP